MATPPPVTETFARFVTATEFDSISSTARANARLHILDTLGVALAGVDQPAARIALEYCGSLGDSAQASIWGTKQKAAASTAAFANGLFAHALDFDDWDAFIHVGHPTSMLFGAALSLGEYINASGRSLLKAYVLGIEMICKLAANCPNVQDRGFHSTPVWGSLGATVACASLLNLDAAKLKAALGIAASAAGGIHRQQGSMVKPFHAGNAARNGAEAALLAAAGFTADAAILEAPRGFCDTFFGAGECDYAKMIENIGAPYFLESPGLGLKWHPCSAPQFLAADAALHLQQTHDIRYDDVAQMEVSIPPLRYARHYSPEVKTGLRGKFTINYVVAMCILDGKLELATFTDERVNQPRVQEAFSKVRVICDESIPEPGPYCPVTVELKNGSRFSYTAKVAKGHPQNPITENEVLEKFRANAKLAISPSQAERLIERVSAIESLDNVKSLTQLLIP
ncbi:MAG TPA: MmgE/PrpD family protein [Candidatus Binatia bacterium]|nr:MmgE/PrpD family protein [Candidatus Binatia bacterium]